MLVNGLRLPNSHIIDSGINYVYVSLPYVFEKGTNFELICDLFYKDSYLIYDY